MDPPIGAFILFWFWANLVTAMFALYVAGTKNRSLVTWGLLTLVFGIVSLVALAGVPALDEERHSLDTEPDPGIGWSDQMASPHGERNA